MAIVARPRRLFLSGLLVHAFHTTPALSMRTSAPRMAAASLVFEPPAKTPTDFQKYVFVGRQTTLKSDGIKSLLPPSVNFETWSMLVDSVDAGDDGDKASTLVVDQKTGKALHVVAAVLPEPCSRHNSPVRAHAVTALVGSGVGGAGSASVVAMLDDASYAAGTSLAIGRAFPLFTAKSSQKPKVGSEGGNEGGTEVHVGFATAAGATTTTGSYSTCAAACDGVRRASRLVDMPPELLTTTAFVEEAAATVSRLSDKGKSVTCTVIRGDELREGGYGLLHGVGKAAEEPPALVVLSYLPPGDAPPPQVVALVGKGIVYDTGGLSLKTKEGMPGMKADMGGAAALLGAFEAAVEIGTDKAVHLLLCLAENAIGPKALRNDDCPVGLSGKSVEINNSDAEGRLVLADGVAHATSLPPRLPGLAAGAQPDVVIDMATLTGAQLIATGKRHAGVVSNSDDWEAAAVAAGKASGDTVFPLPFAPEFYRKEFRSKVADMKNSVKDRSNAQTSCAANFIYEHLHPAFTGGWVHVDLAGPAWIDERGTGFGVGLALSLLEVDGFKPTPPTSA
jgi:probable aminopeptidase NPEPL1